MFLCRFSRLHIVLAILYHSQALQTLQTWRLTHMMKGILKVQILIPCCVSCVPLHTALHAGAPEIYWIRRKTLSLFVIQLRCSELQAERERLLDPDGTPRDGCKEGVYIKCIPTLFLSYDDFIPSIYRLYSCHMTTSFHLYTDSSFLGR